ncbi:MAG: hypothetical protein RL637_652 [Pseudomonadota bacterium]|jgi:hypothetical protein
MINTFKIVFHIIIKYFLIDFIFFFVVLFFTKNAYYFLQWLFLITQMIKIPFIVKFPLDSFAFILFCITWTLRKRKLFNKGFISKSLNHKQIFGRFFVIITVIAMYVDKHMLNNSALQIEPINNKATLFFELLFCWVIAMIVVEIINSITFKLFKL